MKEKQVHSTCDPYQAKTPKVVYHQTFKGNVDKILEFGFDKDLSGQGSRRRLEESYPSEINDDFVEYLETCPENRMINTLVDPLSYNPRYGDDILKIILNPTVRLLDTFTLAKLKDVKWSKMRSYARERRYDGLVYRHEVCLFSNRTIQSIEKMNQIK